MKKFTKTQSELIATSIMLGLSTGAGVKEYPAQLDEKGNLHDAIKFESCAGMFKPNAHSYSVSKARRVMPYFTVSNGMSDLACAWALTEMHTKLCGAIDTELWNNMKKAQAEKFVPAFARKAQNAVFVHNNLQTIYSSNLALTYDEMEEVKASMKAVAPYLDEAVYAEMASHVDAMHRTMAKSELLGKGKRVTIA